MNLPIGVLTDSYKTSHYKQFPKGLKKAVCYGAFRKNFDRMIYMGIDYPIKTFLEKRWSHQDMDMCRKFFEQHGVANKQYPWPEELFRDFVDHNNGYFPVKIESLPAGSVVTPGDPVFQVTALGKYAPLVTFLETLLTMYSWYPSTVATISRQCKDIIIDAFNKSVDPQYHFLIESRLHDFGMRACTCVEQSILGGTAHLVNFTGSDTLSAAYHVQFDLNNSNGRAQSIPAMEHSTVMTWKCEQDAYKNMAASYSKDGLFACVMDTYDYEQALRDYLPGIKDVMDNNGHLVIRPDSGDPVDTVLMALRAAENVFGVTKNSLGFKVLNNSSVIQGDGIDITVIKKILEAVLQSGYSAQNVAFGMGGALLQKVNRDTFSFATKLCFVEDNEGPRGVKKDPKTDPSKASREGPFTEGLETVYDQGPVNNKAKMFDELCEFVETQWNSI